MLVGKLLNSIIRDRSQRNAVNFDGLLKCNVRKGEHRYPRGHSAHPSSSA
jgi:hypothetical protein